jgi:phospholipid-binding lipoprotein MlaA
MALQHIMTVTRRALAPLALLMVAGCATVPGQDRLAERDPLEGFNRAMWGVNRGADKVIIKPVTTVYRTVTPRPARQGVSNFFSNLTEPWSLINNLLQGKPNRAADNLGRFLINSTIGIAGLFDHASKMGVNPAPEDLGQTLAVWGVNGGPYLVLPLLGPSTLRDGVGSGVAGFADPANIAVNQSGANVWVKRGYWAGRVINIRSDLIDSGGDAFLKSSLDPYAAARSAYLQSRRAQIMDQEDGMDAGPPDDMQPAAEGVLTPVGEAGTTPPDPAGAGDQSAAPLPGDEPAATPPETTTPGTTTPDDGAAFPESSAPLPGDDAPPPKPAPLP